MAFLSRTAALGLSCFALRASAVRDASLQEVLDSQKEEVGLSVFATSYNAGNQKFKKIEGMEILLGTLLEGYNGMGQHPAEADIVMMGLQEINDGGNALVEGFRNLLFPKFPPEQAKVFSQIQEGSTFCKLASHYSTSLYVFANPASKWEFRHVPYDSDRCDAEHKQDLLKQTLSAFATPTSKDPNLGCNIDNNGKDECGKVVNLLVIEAVRPEKTLRLCAMNTHMSFKKTGAARMKMIAGAVEEAKNAQCDTLVFTGDFNSRLHCDSSDGKASFYEQPDFVQPFMQKFCNETPSALSTHSCRLKDASKVDVHIDELAQMLDPNVQKLRCIEKDVKGVFIETVPNELAEMGVTEPEVPDFNPTYKLVSHKKAEKIKAKGGTTLCLEPASNLVPGKDRSLLPPSCYGNSDNKGKHNMAWTDRVLIWSDPAKAIKKQTVGYQAKSISSDFGSDHLPVSSFVVFK
eukprot:TRINITY_DN5799_c0_g2_i2.p1 TRINITY_DN5799_c0_g2~~TRINITY_DN5799_c0_g2_i2.p1  ORF type:complete len:462 (-),score=77.14 TRINITY_DN5799_c0_g2_i2:151-1536(-)